MSSVVVGLALLVILGASLLALNFAMRRTGGTSVAATKTDSTESSDPPSLAPPSHAAAPSALEPTAPAGQPVKPAPPAAAVPDPARLGSTPTPSPAPTAPAKGLPAAGSQRLLIRAVELSWIRVQTDDGRVVEELLPAGASREWATERRFVVSIGNAGGVEVTLNGKVLPPLGGKGAVIHRMELPPPPATSGS
jgi:hypothetical protein